MGETPESPRSAGKSRSGPRTPSDGPRGRQRGREGGSGAGRTTGRPAGGSPSTSTVLAISLAGLALVAIVVLVVGSGGGSGNGPSTATTVAGATTLPGSPATTSPPTSLAADAFVEYVDDDAGFSVRYPKTWARFQPTDANLHLVAAEPRADDGPAGIGLTVRMFRVEQIVTSENLANLQTVTDGIVASNPTAKILQRREISIDGMPGYFYLYTFTDEVSGREGAHGHYFLFRGRKMNQLVLQTVPTEDYARLALVFDQIGESFKSTPDTEATLPAAATTTTTTR